MRGISAFKQIGTEFERIRFDLQKERAQLMVKTFPVARKLGLSKVRDIMWIYTVRGIYRMFVFERGWSSSEYEEWLARTLIQVFTR
jgi:hypothetical protein